MQDKGDGMFEAFVQVAQNFVQSYGLAGTLIISVLESFIFPVPTAAFIASSCALGIDPFVVACVSTMGSIFGGLIGYLLGFYFGHPIALRLFHEEKVEKVMEWFDKYGAGAVFIAGFTPIPFKVFTIAAGIAEMRIVPFIIAAFFGRFGQFLIAAYLGDVFGKYLLTLL